MSKFSEYVYERPDVEGYLTEVETFINDVKVTTDYAILREKFLDFISKRKHVMTMMSLAHIRNTIDMSDKFYESEMGFFYSAGPKMDLVHKNASIALLESPCIDDLAAEFGEFYITKMKNGLRLADEAIVEDQVKENQLVQKYHKAAAVCKTTFRGEEMNFYGLLKYMQDTDRSIRKEAMIAWSELYASIADELDDI